VKSLVVYYSRSGNTRRVAEMIARQLGADLQELVDTIGRHGIMSWLRAGRDAMKERMTKLEPLQHQPGDYDYIVVGSPVWAMHPCPAVRTFLSSNDLKGKKVALFCTMNARGGEEACGLMKELISGGQVVGTLAVAMKKQTEEQIEERVNQWISGWRNRS
jgi:flavodoxin